VAKNAGWKEAGAAQVQVKGWSSVLLQGKNYILFRIEGT